MMPGVRLPRTALLLVALVSSACAGPTPPPLRPVADVKQLMVSVLEPAADEYWDGVGTIIDQTGTFDIRPETNEDWDALVNHAYVIAESGNLLMMGGRPKDGGEWMRMSRALVDVGEKAIRAAASHNPQAVFDVGAEVYDVCTACHDKYVQGATAPPPAPTP
jgi:hypothetical protein